MSIVFLFVGAGFGAIIDARASVESHVPVSTPSTCIYDEHLSWGGGRTRDALALCSRENTVKARTPSPQTQRVKARQGEMADPCGVSIVNTTHPWHGTRAFLSALSYMTLLVGLTAVHRFSKRGRCTLYRRTHSRTCLKSDRPA